MKTDLATSIGVAIAGVLISYFVCNLFLGPVEDFTYKTVSSTVSTSITEPDVEVFNYRALNPTVEVYVGECDDYDQYGECLEVHNAEAEDNTNTSEESTTGPTEQQEND